MNVGYIVSRKSYNNDVWFKIQAIKEDIFILKGLYYRLIADAHISDIVTVKETSVRALYRDDEVVEDGLITGIIINDVVNVAIGVSSGSQYHTIRR